jgi:hypothetical protein
VGLAVGVDQFKWLPPQGCCGFGFRIYKNQLVSIGLALASVALVLIPEAVEMWRCLAKKGGKKGGEEAWRGRAFCFEQEVRDRTA